MGNVDDEVLCIKIQSNIQSPRNLWRACNYLILEDNQKKLNCRKHKASRYNWVNSLTYYNKNRKLSRESHGFYSKVKDVVTTTSSERSESITSHYTLYHAITLKLCMKQKVFPCNNVIKIIKINYKYDQPGLLISSH
jgi:hypothetical protein